MLKLFKKWGTLIVTLFFILAITVMCMLGMTSINKYKSTIVQLNEQIQYLENSITDIGSLMTGYVVTQDVRAGELITEDNVYDLVSEVSVPVKLNLGLVGDNGGSEDSEEESIDDYTFNGDTIVSSIDDLIGKYFKIGLKEGTVITVEDMVTNKIESTWRYYDIVLDEIPIGIQVGEYVDVRISFPFGEDFIAMSHKKVEEINSGILKIIVSEDDIMAYNSMLLDKALYNGAKLYAIKYVDGGAQVGAENFYPVQSNLSEIASLDPNILEEIKNEMLLKRQVLDNSIGGTIDSKTEQELANVQSSINQLRNQAASSFTQAQREFDRRVEEAAREAARASQN